MGRLKASPTLKNQPTKANNRELLQIAQGINQLVISHESHWTLAEKHNDMVFDVRFAKPVLKRPLTENDKLVALEWAKMHPRFWRVNLTLLLHDQIANQHYSEILEIETKTQCKFNELTETFHAGWKELENGANPKHIVGRKWEARIINKHERGA